MVDRWLDGVAQRMKKPLPNEAMVAHREGQMMKR
jgi:hypothetical protein